MNKVDYLLVIPFLSLKYGEQLEVKKLGPYQPKDVNITQQDGKKVRTFCDSWFKKKQWLTFSDDKNALFCFYCLIFGGEDLWTRTGCKDLKHLSQKIEKHERSKNHINNVVEFTIFGKVNILSTYDSDNRVNIINHNELVDKNRHILSRIIECIKFCGIHELPVRGCDETQQSNNCGVFFDLISYISKFDNILSDHLKQPEFTRNSILNEILECMYQVYIDEIKKEINNTNFVSMQVYEEADASSQSKFVILLRYNKDSQPVERFLSFVNLYDRTARDFTTVLKHELNPFNIEKKLIAQSYVGGLQSNLHVQMREYFPHAHYIYYDAHKLDLIIKKVCSTNKRIKVFFSALNGFYVFFTSSSRRRDLLIEICQEHVPEDCQTIWKLHSKRVNYIKENKNQVLECFDKITNEDGWDNKTICEAVGLKKIFEDKEFNFFLSFFYEAFKPVDILFDILHSNKSKMIATKETLDNFESCINNVQMDLSKFFMFSEDDIDSSATSSKKLRKDNAINDSLETDARNACTKLVTEMNERFRNYELFHSYIILEPENFELYKQRFPVAEVNTLIKNYPMVNKDNLITELSVIYLNETFRCLTTVNALSKFLDDNALRTTFSEVSKLIEIVLVTPIYTSDAQRSFNTIERIETFLRNKTALDQLNSLAVLSIHKDIIQKIPQFNNKVIEKFSQHGLGKTELLYK